MRTVQIQDVLTKETSKMSTAQMAALVGRMLGEVSVEELVQASHTVKDVFGGVEEAQPPLQEVYMDSEEE